MAGSRCPDQRRQMFPRGPAALDSSSLRVQTSFLQSESSNLLNFSLRFGVGAHAPRSTTREMAAATATRECAVARERGVIGGTTRRTFWLSHAKVESLDDWLERVTERCRLTRACCESAVMSQLPYHARSCQSRAFRRRACGAV